MLPSFESSHFVKGRVQKAVAADCGVSESAFYKWATGRLRCPKHKRQSVDRAFGAPVDWSQYDRECDAITRLSQKSPETPISGPSGDEAAIPAPTPPRPALRPSKPQHTRQTGDWFEDLAG